MSQPNIAQPSPAVLQAALAEKQRTQAQSVLLLQQAQRQASSGTDASAPQPMSTQVSSGTEGDAIAPVITSQDLSVAQMMMTLAQTSNCNTGNALQGSNKQNSSPAQKPPDNTR